MTFKQSFFQNDIKQSPTKTWQGLKAFSNGKVMSGNYLISKVDGTGNPSTWKTPESKMVGGGGKYVALSSNSRK